MPPEAPTKRPLMLVMNAGSGRSDSEAVRQHIAAALDAAGREHRFFFFDDGGDIGRHVADAGALAEARGGAIVAVGGDGTLNAVAGEAIARDIPMGVIPQGTFNFFGRTHGIPPDLDEAVAHLLAAEVTPVQVGQVNGRVFLVNASLGLYPQVLEDREGWKQKLGRHRLVAFWAGLVTMMRPHRSLYLDVSDGSGNRAVRTPTLVVANNALQLEKLGIAEAETVQRNRGELAGVGLRPIGRLAMLGLMVRGAMGTLGDADQVVSFAFRQLVVRSRSGKRRIKVAVDGEILWLDYPLTFVTTRHPLRLLLSGTRQPGEDPG
jgi:diacylglycerol kinase family enzyme